MINLQELLDERLWKEVKRNYLNEQYSNAVLDGVQFLGDLIREMSGEDGDGYNLIGRVFNEKNPKIKVNKLKTKTEKDIQTGIMLLLQGFYGAIRNQRVHEKKIDTEEEACELILFLNHILRIVDKSKGKFTIENTLKRVFDDNFLPREDYVKHIIKDIPANKRYEVAIEVLRNRSNGKISSDLAIFWNSLITDLPPSEIQDIQQEISEILRFANKASQVTSIVLLIGEDWKNLEEDSRLRAENLLIRGLPTYLSNDPREGPHEYEYSVLAESLYELYSKELMALTEEFSTKLYSMLNDSSPALTGFVINYFGGFLKEMENNAPFINLKDVIIKRFQAGDKLLLSFIEKVYTKDEVNELKNHLPPFALIDDELPF